MLHALKGDFNHGLHLLKGAMESLEENSLFEVTVSDGQLSGHQAALVSRVNGVALPHMRPMVATMRSGHAVHLEQVRGISSEANLKGLELQQDVIYVPHGQNWSFLKSLSLDVRIRLVGPGVVALSYRDGQDHVVSTGDEEAVRVRGARFGGPVDRILAAIRHSLLNKGAFVYYGEAYIFPEPLLELLDAVLSAHWETTKQHPR